MCTPFTQLYMGKSGVYIGLHFAHRLWVLVTIASLRPADVFIHIKNRPCYQSVTFDKNITYRLWYIRRCDGHGLCMKKTFSTLKSAVHDIYPTNKNEHARIFSSAQTIHLYELKSRHKKQILRLYDMYF